MLLSSSTKKILQIDKREMIEIYGLREKWKLGFDDAHLKFIAEREGLRIATFDKHLLKYPEIAIHPSKL
jgi:predicted nucleic acid-binding protein